MPGGHPLRQKKRFLKTVKQCTMKIMNKILVVLLFVVISTELFAEAYFDDNRLKLYNSEIVSTTNTTTSQTIQGIQFKNKIVVTGNIIFDDIVNFYDDTFIGMIAAFATDNAPAGWLLCDGSEYPIANYQTLATRIGSQWNAISGAPAAGNFRVPDLDQRFLRPNQNATPTLQNQAVAFPHHRAYTSANSGPSHTHTIHDAGVLNTAGGIEFFQFNLDKGQTHSHDSQSNPDTRQQTSDPASTHRHHLGISLASLIGQKMRPKHMVVRYFVYAGN